MRFTDSLSRSERSELNQMEAAGLLGISGHTFPPSLARYSVCSEEADSRQRQHGEISAAEPGTGAKMAHSGHKPCNTGRNRQNSRTLGLQGSSQTGRITSIFPPVGRTAQTMGKSPALS